ncbi:hypothetical protein [Rubrobacter indicoceani]|uniref:hypothetical protein n=1 Tax=Rubrobacter indicoceani TaxID=2051957 RepID=UPI000E5AC461|nr:hypothetical protein [Rubrobacter indicoceani]
MEYIVDQDGERKSVVLSVEEYERMLDLIEELEDIRLLDEAKARRGRGEGDYVRWDGIRDKIGSEYESR